MSEGLVEELERAYRKGELNHIKIDLEEFLRAKKVELRDYRTKLSKFFRKELTMEESVKIYILQARSVNPRHEILEQLQEIKRMYNPADKGFSDINSWANYFSIDWRDHRTTSIIFVFDQNKEYYLRILEAKED